MQRENRYTKRIFFKDVETAKRFCDLYGYPDRRIISCNDNSFNLYYYGEKVRGLISIYIMITTREFQQMMKYIGLKEKRGIKGRKYYVYE